MLDIPNSTLGDSFGKEDEFIVGPKGNRVNVMMDEDGVTMFRVSYGSLGITECSITLTRSMLIEIYRRAVGGIKRSEQVGNADNLGYQER